MRWTRHLLPLLWVGAPTFRTPSCQGWLKLIFGSSHVCLGLGAKYFRILLQSNCGASVLDFTPRAGGGPPIVRLNRLNQVRVIVLCSSTHILYGWGTLEMLREHGGTMQYRFHLQYYFVLGIFLSNIILLSRCTCTTRPFLLACSCSSIGTCPDLFIQIVEAAICWVQQKQHYMHMPMFC
jgi:hypothetical protein